jgi:hypothetical protein
LNQKALAGLNALLALAAGALADATLLLLPPSPETDADEELSASGGGSALVKAVETVILSLSSSPPSLLSSVPFKLLEGPGRAPKEGEKVLLAAADDGRVDFAASRALPSNEVEGVSAGVVSLKCEGVIVAPEPFLPKETLTTLCGGRSLPRWSVATTPRISFIGIEPFGRVAAAAPKKPREARRAGKPAAGAGVLSAEPSFVGAPPTSRADEDRASEGIDDDAPVDPVSEEPSESTDAEDAMGAEVGATEGGAPASDGGAAETAAIAGGAVDFGRLAALLLEDDEDDAPLLLLVPSSLGS